MYMSSNEHPEQYSLEEIYAFLISQLGIAAERKKLRPEISLHDDLHVDGEDFWELEEAFAKRFNVDMSNYRWYFHHGDEASLNFGGLFFAPPNKRVKSIPVTPKVLMDSANAGKWVIEYPPHKLPDARYDMYINWILFLPFWLWLAYICLKKFAIYLGF